ncbi:putative signal transduction response regulator, receiver domain protein [Candidatus Nitrososphaera gargensis Ga9.2]|uniref:Putative signal transduction response regulator, receiver domain protein n=1 Tax=Nitrososphaera gargensis (strain Ga9.2) TaxID=1237085 RepID=K0IMD4_NITGG|nr:response regulator [Candidatus Nitrososphaera gargensis]AFU57814.1 putative signal transduction response regulator, receiver domain protein [Candidatus Nitrososphaera gargensis Ga9.2]
MPSDYEQACKSIVQAHELIDLAMVIDKFANIVAKASRPSPSSSIGKMSPEDIARTAMRVNIGKGAFNASKNKTGSSSIHARYNAMDMVVQPLDNDLSLIVIGLIDAAKMPELLDLISKTFPTKIKRAIVVDDEPDIRVVIKELLEKRGFQVTLCASGRDCIRTLEKAREDKIEFGVVILDVRMPEMDGFQTFKEIQAISSNTNVLFITAFEYSQKDIAEKISSPKVHLLHKPFSRTELLQSINEVIES